jgi:hypothetical protein
MYVCICIYTARERERERERSEIHRELGERERERGEREERGREDAETFMCTHICAADPLILSRYPAAKRLEFSAGVHSAKFRALTAEQRAKGTGDSPTTRLEITAAMPFNFALLRLGQHQLALGHSTRQLPCKNRRA